MARGLPKKQQFTFTSAAVPVKTETTEGKSFDDLSPEKKKRIKQFWLSLQKKC